MRDIYRRLSGMFDDTCMTEDTGKFLTWNVEYGADFFVLLYNMGSIKALGVTLL